MVETIRTHWPTWMPAHPHITTITPVSENRAHTVWKVATQTGPTFAIKHHLFAPLTKNKPYDLLFVEQKISNTLYREGCPVAPIIQTDPQHSMAISPWCGDRTIDDYCQTKDPQSLAPTILNAIASLEAGFQKHQAHWATHIAPGCSLADLKTAWFETTSPITDIVPDLIGYLTNKTQPAHLQTHWQALIAQQAEAPATLGPTDYNARNIVLDDSENPTILELAKIGYDWPERRLIQYTTSLGATQSHARIISLLTPQNITHYAHQKTHHKNPDVVCTHTEAHHLIFHLLAAITCLQATNEPDHPWQNIPHRLADITQALKTPLFDTEQTRVLRMAFQT